MSGTHLPDLVRAAKGKRVVCVGDVMLDRFIYGGVTRISPEAPVPIMRRTREAAMPGGAGNVARNLASLGLSVLLVRLCRCTVVMVACGVCFRFVLMSFW